MKNCFVVFVIAVCVVPLFAQDGHPQTPLLKHHMQRDVDDYGRPGARIVGGQNAVEGQFPFVTAITIDDSFFCTSSLLSHRWIVTAAHCAVETSTFGVRLGITNFGASEDGVVATRSRTVVVNPYYSDANSSCDIALIMMVSSVTYTAKIQPVKLPTRSMASNFFVGTAVREMGWGISNDYPTTVSPILNYVDLQVISNDDCNRQFPGIIDDSIICAYAKGNKSACGGDSGGPLVMNLDSPVLIGVADFIAYGGCWAGGPVGFARVTHFLDWISATTGIAIHN